MDYKPWSELSDTERVELMLAHHKGKSIDHLTVGVWRIADKEDLWRDKTCYRLTPSVVTRSLFSDGCYIHYKLMDGVPDCNSVWMEKV